MLTMTMMMFYCLANAQQQSKVDKLRIWYLMRHSIFMYLAQGRILGPYNATCRVLNFWPPTERSLNFEKSVCYTLKFACFVETGRLSSFQDNLLQKLSLTDNWHCSCSINTPLTWTLRCPNDICQMFQWYFETKRGFND